MSGLILHHYACSPFSEKVRLVMGIKGLSWDSVEVPSILPKPDLVALTGGYRHVPVLQIGAEVFCDTRLIVREIERRHPQPTLFPSGTCGLSTVVEAWADRDLFWPIARFVSGINAETLGDRFHADRAALRGKAAPSRERLQATAERARDMAESQVPIVEEILEDGRRYLLGESLSLADVSVYHGLWFLGAFSIDCTHLLAGFPLTLAWMARIRSIGHGRPRDMDSKSALSIAANSRCDGLSVAAPEGRRPRPGTRVTIRPEGYETTGVSGVVAHASHDRIVVLRVTNELGDVMVHFPRAGYIIKECS